MTPQQEDLLRACLALRDKIREVVPDKTKHWAVEKIEDSILALQYTINGVRTRDY